jgi:hypothetical protein
MASSVTTEAKERPMFGRLDANFWTAWAGALVGPEVRPASSAGKRELDSPRGGNASSSSSTLLKTVEWREGAGRGERDELASWALGRVAWEVVWAGFGRAWGGLLPSTMRATLPNSFSREENLLDIMSASCLISDGGVGGWVGATEGAGGLPQGGSLRILEGLPHPGP